MNNDYNKEQKLIVAKPFLRWAGGKNWLIRSFESYLPNKINNYHEPFLGGGSVFFHLKSKNLINGTSFLSDSNIELINAFKVVRSYCEQLIDILKEYRNEEEFYYKIRKSKCKDSFKSAANFIFLNRTSFNGIFRVNQKGEYNVPYGHKNYKILFDFDNLKNCSHHLKNVELGSYDFDKSLEKINKHDLIFIDPPYTVAHGNNGFVKYNQKIFAWEDQIRLKKYIDNLNIIGANYILTNAYHESVFELYKESAIVKKLSRASVVGGRHSSRGNIYEYIISNIGLQ